MPIFPSKEWCEQAAEILNSDPDSALAARGWKGDFGVIVDPEPGYLTRPFVVHFEPKEGQIRSFEVLSDPDDLDELEPAYRARARYSVWKSLLSGKLDPVEALLKRQVQVVGDVQPLIERMKFKHVADRVLDKIAKLFDEGA